MSSRLDDLVRAGRIALCKVDLGPRRWPSRSLYLTPDFEAWIDELPDDATIASRLVSPFIEWESTAAAFIAGAKVVTLMTAIDPPTGEGIVRLKTTSFGLIGWADDPQRLVLSRGVSVDESHGTKKLEELGREAVAERTSLGLNWCRGHFHELFKEP